MAALAWPSGSPASRCNCRLTIGALASVTPAARISAICKAKARMLQMPLYQASMIFIGLLGVQIDAATTEMKVRMTA